MKIVVNKCYGGFGLSDAAIQRYSDLAGLNLKLVKSDEFYQEVWYKNGIQNDENYFSVYELERTDPYLIQTVEELGEISFGDYSNLEVIEIPDDIEWTIEDYDGYETIHEKHRSW